MKRRAAIISYHSSPLLEPGTGDSGGMTIFVRALTEALAKRGISTDIYTRSTGVHERVKTLSPGVRVISIDAGPPGPLAKADLPRYLDELTTGIRAFTMTQRLGYDIIHSHYWHSGLVGSALATAWDVPLVHSHHTLGLVKNRFLAPGDAPEPNVRLEGERSVIEGADVLVASTDEEWGQLSCLYGAPHDRLKVVHPGVNHEIFTPGDRAAARRELGLTDELTVLYVGRIQPLKGLELAIRSVEQLVPALDRPLRFIVVGGASGSGGDDEVERLQNLVSELDLDTTVRFVGAQPHFRLPTFYRAADALVVCSYSESFGLAALEAHACGTPVVATPVGGLSHIVADGESGFLVDTRDPSTFAGRLKTLLSDEDLRASFSEKAARVAQNFSWDNTADSLRTLYDCLIEEREPELCTC
ncbi:MAG TPA: glycosyltransferase [Actinomycetota bacterium]|nr:glycosyltransferase [Actinomycetota bacterium]